METSNLKPNVSSDQQAKTAKPRPAAKSKASADVANLAAAVELTSKPKAHGSNSTT